jgi:toxin CptA
LDLQRLLLLRWHGAAGGVQWLWAERARHPDRWDALRRAVYSRATPDALQGAKPPAAKP